MEVKFQNKVIQSNIDNNDLYCAENPDFSPVSVENSKMGKQFASTPYINVESATEKPSIPSFVPYSDSDPSVLMNMLKTEFQLSTQYLKNSNVKDNDRKILLRWMFEVVSDQKMEDAIFIQAANYLDRFLSCTTIDKTMLQLLGCCCLFLASKVRNYLIISSRTLSDLTDGCFTEDEIRTYEPVVIGKLGWNLTPVLSTDYLEPILQQSSLAGYPFIKKHATAFLSMLTLYSETLEYSPSFLASSSIYTALTSINPGESVENQLLSFLYLNLNITKDQLLSMKSFILNSMNHELSLQEQMYRNEEDLDSSYGSDSGISDTTLVDSD